VIRRLAVGICGALLLTLTASGVAAAHDVNPPNGGIGDTPLNSSQALTNALDHFVNAVEQGQAENALLRNPTCSEHAIHPPGNP
jgi:hypothetical protein